MKPRVVFFGSGEYTIPIIEKLKNFDLGLIVTTDQGKDEGRYKSEFKKYLTNQTIPVLVSNLKSKNDREKIKKVKPTIGILASYGAILPQSVIETFTSGILNIHPSLLPKYKGPSPIQATILENDLATGVTVIRLDDQIDHGPIVEQGIVQLKGNETTQDLKHFLFAQGAELIDKILRDLEAGEPLISQDQDHSQETFTKKITRQDGKISLENPPDPDTLHRMIRAYYPWPGVWMKFASANLNPKQSQKITTDKPSALERKIIKLLPEEKIQVEGKKPMTIRDFINGYKEGKEIILKLGLLFE